MRCVCCTACARQATRPFWSAAACATCCSASRRRISTSRPARCRKRSSALFRNCRLIGRRFRLAHVFFGREIIEVATFRAMSAPERGEAIPEPPAADLDDDDRRRDARRRADDESRRNRRKPGARRGRSTPDGVSGRNAPMRERDRSRHAGATATTRRRPRHRRARPHPARQRLRHASTTTCGAAISPPTRCTTTSPTSRSGTTSAASRTSPRRRLKLIGDPATRYREDPVRMLRAARFEAKLGFSLDGETGSRYPACAIC